MAVLGQWKHTLFEYSSLSFYICQNFHLLWNHKNILNLFYICLSIRQTRIQIHYDMFCLIPSAGSLHPLRTGGSHFWALSGTGNCSWCGPHCPPLMALYPGHVDNHRLRLWREENPGQHSIISQAMDFVNTVLPCVTVGEDCICDWWQQMGNLFCCLLFMMVDVGVNAVRTLG